MTVCFSLSAYCITSPSLSFWGTRFKMADHILYSKPKLVPKEFLMNFRFADHNLMHMLAIFAAGMTFNFTILFTSGALGHRLGLFTNNTNLAEKFYLDKYKLDVTPADWSFYQSAVIYFWQSLWLTYSVFNVCRRNELGYLYVAYPVLPPIFYVVFAFSLACNISWLLIWDREYLEVALVFINLMCCTLFICLVVSLRRLNEFGYIMVSHGLMKEVWLMRILVQNGLAMFAIWSMVASMFNFGVVLTYRTGARQDVASTVSLSIFTLEILVWWLFDNVVFEKYFRYLFTPYIVLLISIAGIISKNYQAGDQNTNTIYTVILFGIVAILSIVKVVLVTWRHKHQPLYGPTSEFRRSHVGYEVRGLLDNR